MSTFSSANRPPIGTEVVTREGCRRTVTATTAESWVDEHGEEWAYGAIYHTPESSSPVPALEFGEPA